MQVGYLVYRVIRYSVEAYSKDFGKYVYIIEDYDDVLKYNIEIKIRSVEIDEALELSEILPNVAKVIRCINSCNIDLGDENLQYDRNARLSDTLLYRELKQQFLGLLYNCDTTGIRRFIRDYRTD